jgi:hypothetical protein
MADLRLAVLINVRVNLLVLILQLSFKVFWAVHQAARIRAIFLLRKDWLQRSINKLMIRLHLCLTLLPLPPLSFTVLLSPLLIPRVFLRCFCVVFASPFALPLVELVLDAFVALHVVIEIQSHWKCDTVADFDPTEGIEVEGESIQRKC